MLGRKHSRWALLGSLALSVLLAAPLWAQSVTGTLQGVVTDSNGAVIPNAEIKARNAATGAELTLTTNAEGLYRFALVHGMGYTSGKFGESHCPQALV